MTVLGDEDEIFDAHAEAPWKVHARLDRDDIALSERASHAVAEARLLVHVDPHAVPGGSEIERSTLVVLDLGALVGGYCSDCTRTFATGPSEPQMMDVYETVLAAQEAALALVRPGQDCQEVHETARRVIAERGYGEFFNHGTGHGVGIDMHEEPRFRNGMGGTLAQGNVVTVEPGVYLPERFGVRIEDLVLVTDDGHEVLTQFPKSLLSV